MKKVTWLGLSLLLVVGMLLASCSTSTTTTTQTSTTASMTTIPPGGETVLTVIEGNKVNNFSLMDLRALPSVTGYGGYVSQSGTITGPFPCQGVALTNLLNTVGGISQGENVVFTSSDNYALTLSYDQITNGNFNYYDTTGNPITPQTMPTLTLIYSENGTLLDKYFGPVELGMLSPQNILTDGSLWAKMVTTITVTSDTSGLVSSVTPATTSPTTAVTSSTTSSTSLVQTTTPTQNTATPEDADFRLPTPAGVVVYEGNLNGARLVPTITLTFSADNDSIYINYRASITTTQGSDRNEIISIFDSAGKIRYNQIGPYSYVGDVTLTVQGLPVGITAEYDTPGFVFHISNDAKPGQYSFQIIATINGKTYLLPCTITVL